MRFSSLLVPLLSLGGLALAASKDVDVTIKFPDTNPFGRVKNGVSTNLLHVRLANHAGEEIIVTSVHGQYREAGGKLRTLRNTTNLPLRQSVLPGLASPLIPYRFHSENKIGEVGLRVWVDYLDAGKKPHTVLGYDGNVTVIEPPTSWFDLQLLSLYAILAVFFYFVGTFLWSSYIVPAVVPTTSTKRGPKKSAGGLPTPVPSTPVPKGTVDDEWIPEHILRQRRKDAAAAEKKDGYSSPVSGDESAASGGGKKGKKGRK